jgi:hypothetical protein
MFTIESKFIGNFKLGDNIAYNFKIITLLYEVYEVADESEKRLLCKPCIVFLASIAEAVLHDLRMRIKLFTVEGVKNVSSSVIQTVRLKKIDDFKKYIESARARNLFDQADKEFYDRLDDLRRLRNRIHMQNKDGDFEPDEFNAFSPDRMGLAEQVVDKLLRTMERKYARNHDYVEKFELPWHAHYPPEEISLKRVPTS